MGTMKHILSPQLLHAWHLWCYYYVMCCVCAHYILWMICHTLQDEGRSSWKFKFGFKRRSRMPNGSSEGSVSRYIHTNSQQYRYCMWCCYMMYAFTLQVRFCYSLQWYTDEPRYRWYWSHWFLPFSVTWWCCGKWQTFRDNCTTFQTCLIVCSTMLKNISWVSCARDRLLNNSGFHWLQLGHLNIQSKHLVGKRKLFTQLAPAWMECVLLST